MDLVDPLGAIAPFESRCFAGRRSACPVAGSWVEDDAKGKGLIRSTS